MFISVYEHLFNVASVLGCLTVADFAIELLLLAFCTKIIHLRHTTWFFLHALANVFICIFSFNSFINTLYFPNVCANGDVFTDRSMFGASSVWPLTISNGIHLYHMYGGFTLSSADYFHHLLFIPTLSFPGQYYNWGSLSNSQALFVTGLPGGIDYFLLGLVKTGVIAKNTEKRANVFLNTWIRAPGMLFTSTLLYQSYMTGNVKAPTWSILIQLVLAPFNAIYFNKQAIENNIKHSKTTSGHKK